MSPFQWWPRDHLIIDHCYHCNNLWFCPFHSSHPQHFLIIFANSRPIMSWVLDAQPFSIEHKGFHKMPQTYHFGFSHWQASCTELCTCPPICKSQACFSFAWTVCLSTQLSSQGKILIQDVFQISALVCQLPQYSGLKLFLLSCFLSTLSVIAHDVQWPSVCVLDVQL